MLMLVCLVVGALSGLVGMFLGSLSGWADAVLGEDPHAPMFLISCIIGFSLSFILMGVIISAVDSVIVCFAEAPGTFPLSLTLRIQHTTGLHYPMHDFSCDIDQERHQSYIISFLYFFYKGNSKRIIQRCLGTWSRRGDKYTLRSAVSKTKRMDQLLLSISYVIDRMHTPYLVDNYFRTLSK